MRREFTAKRDPSGLNISVFDAAKQEDEIMRSAILAAPFLAERRLIIIENLFTSKRAELEQWLEFLKTQKDNKNVVIFWEGESDDKPAAFFDFLKGQKYSQIFETLERVKLLAWINQEVQSLGLGIESGAVKHLAQEIGGDLWRLSQELQKAAALARGSGKKTISLIEVKNFIEAGLDDNVFHFVEALVSRNSARAFELLVELRQSAVAEPEVFGAIIWQIKTLLTIKNYFEKNQTTETAAAQTLDLHPFVIKKALLTLPRFSFNQLLESYQILLDLDIKTKTRSVSSAALFDLLVAKMTA